MIRKHIWLAFEEKKRRKKRKLTRINFFCEAAVACTGNVIFLYSFISFSTEVELVELTWVHVSQTVRAVRLCDDKIK